MCVYIYVSSKIYITNKLILKHIANFDFSQNPLLVMAGVAQ